jgi:hypothetical protein
MGQSNATRRFIVVSTRVRDDGVGFVDPLAGVLFASSACLPQLRDAAAATSALKQKHNDP